jgi:hypothetical protein
LVKYTTKTTIIFFRKRERKKEKECLLTSEVEGCVKVLQTKILPEGVEIFV